MEKPKPPECRVQCGYCYNVMPESEFNVHFCMRHEKLMKVLPYFFLSFVLICTAISLGLSMRGL